MRNVQDAEPAANLPAAASSHLDWRGVIWYLLLAFGIAWMAWIGLQATGLPLGPRIWIGMFGPAFACLLVRLVRREGWSDAGLLWFGADQQKRWGVYLAAYLLPILFFLLGSCLALLTGIQHWQFPSYLQQAHLTLAAFLWQLLNGLTLGVCYAMGFAFGEELGWRGYLLPRLLPLGAIPAALLIGVIWGLWHTPVLLLYGLDSDVKDSWVSVGLFVLFVTALSFLFTWLRLRSGSIWSTVLAHGVINTVAPLLFAFLTRANLYVGIPNGLLGILPFLGFALWLIATGRLNVESRA